MLFAQATSRSTSYKEKTYPCTANTGKRLPKNRRANLAIQFKGPDLPTSQSPHLNSKLHTSREFKKGTDTAVNANGIEYPLKQHAENAVSTNNLR